MGDDDIESGPAGGFAFEQAVETDSPKTTIPAAETNDNVCLADRMGFLALERWVSPSTRKRNEQFVSCAPA